VTRPPWLTAAPAALCLLLWWADGGAAFAYLRDAVAGAAWWRLFTGHLSHYSGAHLGWNMLAFGLAAGWIERALGAWVLLRVVAASAFGIGLLLTGLPGLAEYRGLSGINTALVAYLICHLALGAGPRLKGVAWGLAGLLVIKLGFEALTGASLLLSGGGVWVPLPAAHLVGALIGLGAALVPGFHRLARPVPGAARGLDVP